MATRTILIGGDSRANLGDFAPEPVLLAALTASKIPVEWYEAVAIVQEVSRHLLGSPRHQSGGDVSVNTVRIELTGQVLVSADAATDAASAVPQLGALLRDLLPETMPVPLRLAVSQAMSSPPHYTSIESFSEALSYFERPDRAAIIRAVYARWEAGASGRTIVEPRHDSARQTQTADETPATDVRKTRRKPAPRMRWLAVAGTVVLAMALGVAAAIWFPGLDRRAIDVLTDSLQPSSDGSPDADAAKTAATQTATPASRVSVGPAAARPDANANTRILPEQTESFVGLRPDGASSLLPASPTNNTSATSDVRRETGSQLPAAADLTAPVMTLVEAVPDSRIYSALDTEVAAPVAAYPYSPTVATVLDDDEMLTFDLVIDESGRVESVKLQRAPRSIRSALMLTMSMSVAKAWRFQPATRNGLSVKYRQSISVPALE